jgi:hypothetical protein
MSERDPLPSPARRAFLQSAAGAAGVAAGLVASGGAAGLGLLGRPAWADWDFRRTAAALWDDLSPAQRAAIGLAWDHPSRQMLSHVACLDTPRLAEVLTAPQRALAHRLYETMTSPAERRRFGRLIGLEGGGLDPANFVFYGDPRTERSQVAFSGGHLLIRGGGATREGSAFGGPLAYGHQIGNGVPRLPGNAFAHHGDAANALYARLGPDERRRALVAGEPPFETAVQLQGAGGRFAGLAVRDLDDARKADLESLVGLVLGCYDAADRAAALACVERSGGMDALHLAYWTARGFYDDGAAWADLDPAERARRGDPYWHVWRIEGPGTLLHFRGWDHVHASIHVADQGGAGQHVGEVLAVSPALLEGEPLRALVTAALAEGAGEALGFHPPELPARIPPGPLTTGLAWCFDPYRDDLVVATLPGRGAPAPLREALAAQGRELREAASLRVAMPAYAATRSDWVGEAERVEPTGLGLRTAYERYFRAHGLDAIG